MKSLNQFGSLFPFWESNCSQSGCGNEAVFYDSRNRGYCLSHAPSRLTDD